MRRAPIILSATALGLAGTVALQPHKPEAATTATTARATPSTATAASSSSTAARTSAATSSSSSSATKTYTGDAIATQYGDVQVKITVKDAKVTAVTAVALPANDPHSQQISTAAEPTLQASALKAQSASFDGVSGATFTSGGYKASLQAALDQAGLAGSANQAN
jgi:uncharacterized protein with FMN-binding domain